jgi:hypothetical protein
MAKKKITANDLIQMIAGTVKNEPKILNEVKEYYTPSFFIDMGNVLLNYQVESQNTGMASNMSLQLLGGEGSGKSLIMKIIMRNFQKMFDDSVCELIETEGGVDATKLEKEGLDLDRIVMTEVNHTLELKDAIREKLKKFKLGHHWGFFVDSIGNLASEAEYNLKEGESYAALGSKARESNLMFKVILAPASRRSVPMVFINRKYDSMNTGAFLTEEQKSTVAGGKSQTYAPSVTLSLTKKTRYKTVEYFKEDGKKSKKKVPIATDITSTADKARRSKDKTKITFTIHNKKGLLRYSGLSEFAINYGLLEKVQEGRMKNWKLKHTETTFRELDEITSEAWENELKNGFGDMLHEEFKQSDLYQEDSEIAKVK